jgi:hypothetical protein
MKIIDTFMFSEPYETDVLWVKLNVENTGVDEWVIIENAYTFQGDFKGHFLKDILKNDKRFSQFLDKIKLIETSYTFSAINQIDTMAVNEVMAFKAEFKQREASKEYILNKYSPKDWVFLSDTDECLDLSNGKLKLLMNKLNTVDRNLVKIPGVKYIYDYDNIVIANRSTPIVRLDNEILKEVDYSFGEIRKKNVNGTNSWAKEMVFEYSFCFNKEGIEKKLNSFAHTGADFKKWKIGLELNCLPSRDGAIPSLNKIKSWHHSVSLNRFNSPQFVRDNISLLKTGIIDTNFKTNRKKRKPQYFSGINGIITGILFFKYKVSLWKARL